MSIFNSARGNGMKLDCRIRQVGYSIVGVIALVFALFLVTCTKNKNLLTPDDASSFTASASGTVTDIKGRPLSDAMVTAYPSGLTTLTDSHGRFLIGGIPSGKQVFSFRKADYLDTMSDSVPFALLDKKNLDTAASLVYRFGWIKGAVVGFPADSMVDAAIQVENQTATTRTFPEGNFSPIQVDPGQLKVYGVVKGIGYGTTITTVASSDTDSVAISINRKGGTVNGTVVDSAKKPLTNTVVSTMGGLIADTTGKSGQFVLTEVPSEGSISLMIQSGNKVLMLGGVSAIEAGTINLDTVALSATFAPVNGMFVYPWIVSGQAGDTITLVAAFQFDDTVALNNFEWMIDSSAIVGKKAVTTDTTWTITKYPKLKVLFQTPGTYRVHVRSVSVSSLRSNLADMEINISAQGNKIWAESGTGGAITFPGTFSVAENGSKTYSFIADSSHIIDSICVDGKDTLYTDTFYTFKNVKANHSIRAVFRTKTFTISSSAGDSGSITPKGDSVVVYNAGMTFQIKPKPNYEIDSITDNGVLQTADTVYTLAKIKADHVIRVTFKQLLAPAVLGQPQSQTVASGHSVTMIASANGTTPMTFVWKLNGVTKDSATSAPGIKSDTLSISVITAADTGNWKCIIINDAGIDSTAVAKLAIDTQFVQSASAGTGGTISPNGDSTVHMGDSIRYTIHVSTGYLLDSVLVDGKDTSIADSILVLSTIVKSHTIRVVFILKTFTVTTNAGTGGTISPTDNAVAYGSNKTITIAPTTGYLVDSLIVDGTPSDSTTSFTFANVTAAHTIRAVFRLQALTVTSSKNTGGTITPLGASTVSYGDSLVYAIAPTTGYLLDSLILNGNDTTLGTSFTIRNITATTTIRAVFKLQTFTVTSSKNTGGTITPLGASTVNYGDSIVYSISTNTGYLIDSLIVDNVSKTVAACYTVKNVTTAHTVRVVFKKQTFTVTSSNGANGTITPLGATTVNYGDSVVYTITPGGGYTYDSLILDGNDTTVGASFTVRNVTANMTIKAVFKVPTYKVTYFGNGSNRGMVPIDAVNHLSADRVTVLDNTGDLVDTGYYFAGWNTQPDTLGTMYPAGGFYTIASADVSLYAVWRPLGVGTAWTIRSSGYTKALIRDVAWNGSKYVAVSDSGTLTSTDAVTWSLVNAADNNLMSIKWANGQFIADGKLTGVYDNIYTSPDGTAWTKVTSFASYGSSICNSVVWNGSQYVAVGQNGKLEKSIDGSTWTDTTTGFSDFNLKSIVWTGSQFVAVGDSMATFGAILTSPDAVTWTSQPTATTSQLYSVAWNGSVFVAVGGNGDVELSSNGTSWSSPYSGSLDLYSVVWSGSEFVSVFANADQTHVFSSPDGTAWTDVQIVAFGTTANSIVSTGSQLCVVGYNGRIATSP